MSPLNEPFTMAHMLPFRAACKPGTVHRGEDELSSQSREPSDSEPATSSRFSQARMYIDICTYIYTYSHIMWLYRYNYMYTYLCTYQQYVYVHMRTYVHAHEYIVCVYIYICIPFSTVYMRAYAHTVSTLTLLPTQVRAVP